MSGFFFFLLKRETKAFCVGFTRLKLEALVQRYKVKLQAFQLTAPADICIPGFPIDCGEEVLSRTARVDLTQYQLGGKNVRALSYCLLQFCFE